MANGGRLRCVEADSYEKLTKDDVAKQLEIVIGLTYLYEAKRCAAHEMIKDCFKKLLKQSGMFDERGIDTSYCRN